MRLPSLRPWPPVLPVGEDTYQEFTAGTIPVKRVVTGEEDLVIVEHEWGILRAFDEYLEAIRGGKDRPRLVDYTVTWAGMTGSETKPRVIRLELRVDGLRARPRLLFHGIAMTPLWMLTRRAMLGFNVDRDGVNLASPLEDLWLLGPTPVPSGLRRVLIQAGVPRPQPLPPQRSSRHRPHNAKRRTRTHGRRRARADQQPTKRTEGDHHA
jgi:hypothetical protein